MYQIFHRNVLLQYIIIQVEHKIIKLDGTEMSTVGWTGGFTLKDSKKNAEFGELLGLGTSRFNDKEANIWMVWTCETDWSKHCTTTRG